MFSLLCLGPRATNEAWSNSSDISDTRAQECAQMQEEQREEWKKIRKQMRKKKSRPEAKILRQYSLRCNSDSFIVNKNDSFQVLMFPSLQCQAL